MYKTRLRKALACTLALVMAVSTLVGFPSTVFAEEGTSGGRNTETVSLQSQEENPFVTGGRVRNTETVGLGWDSLPEFDPNRPWYQDEDGTIWQDGIPFANMDDVFIFDNVVPLQRRLHDWQDRRITSSDQDLINMADRLILAYLHNNNMTLEEALAISHAELPFIILNGEAVRTDTRGVAYTEISEESVHPLAAENPRMFNPVYQPDANQASVVRSNLVDGIVVPIYHSEHPGGYIFGHEFSLINSFEDTYLKVRRHIPEETSQWELALMWIYDTDPRTRIEFIERYPEKFRMFNTWEIMSSFSAWSFEEMEFIPMSEVTPNAITPLSSFDARFTAFSSIVAHPVGNPDNQWFVWFSARPGNDYRVWFSDFTFNIGFIQFFAYCGNPWQATPQAMNPGSSSEAQGLTGRTPWRADEKISTQFDNRRGARIATGAAGTAASNVQAEPRQVTPAGETSQDIFDIYWVGGGAIIAANAGDATSNLSTIGMGDLPPSRPGGEITIQVTPGEPFALPITHQFGINHSQGIEGGALQANITADPAWFSNSARPLNAPFSIAYHNEWAFTVDPNIQEEQIVVYITPTWAQSLSGGWRSTSGNHQDIWFALPWFQWRIIIELIPSIPTKPDYELASEDALVLAQQLGFDLSGIAQEVFECITGFEPLSIPVTPECTPDEDALQQALTAFINQLNGMDTCEEILECTEPKECTLPKPNPGDCTPWAFELCGDHSCYEFNRGDHQEPTGSTGLQDEESTDLRWNNLAFAFGETHMATEGFNNAGPSTPAGSINLTRTSEVFQAMAGMPETEFLYVNLGGHEGTFDVEYTWHRRVYQFAVWWVESDYCPLFCEATVIQVCDDCGGCCGWPGDDDGDGGCPGWTAPKTVGTHNNTINSPVGTMHSDWGRTWSWSDISAVDSTPGNPQNETIALDGPGSFRVNEDYAQADFRFLEIRWGQSRRATSTAVHNAHLYQPADVPITQTPITLQDLSTNINGTLRSVEPGRNGGPINEGDNRYYGTDGNLSMFEYKWFALHYHTEGKPSPRCFNQTSENVFRSQTATAHAMGIAELGNLFSRNANLVYLLGVNQYQFVRTGGHGSGGPFLVGGPGGTNLVQGQLGQWHDAPYPNPIDLHSAPNVNYFAPLGEAWHAYNITPVSGFQGRYHRNDGSRNGRAGHNPTSVIPGHNPEFPQIAWHNPSHPIITRLHNNIYNFMPFLQQNWLNYIDNIVTFPNGATARDIKSTTEWQGPGHLSQTTSAVDTGQHLTSPNHVRLEYTAWQVPSSPYSIPQGPHQNLTDPTAYFGINPVIIHNPVASIFAWVHDVPSFTLQDQRIRTVGQQQDGGIIPHERRVDYNAAARLYVDFDFRITIPNDGTFISYWHFEPVQDGHPIGRDRWGAARSSPLHPTHYIGRGSEGLGLDGRRPGGVPAPASGLVNFDPAPLVHNTGFRLRW